MFWSGLAMLFEFQCVCHLDPLVLPITPPLAVWAFAVQHNRDAFTSLVTRLPCNCCPYAMRKQDALLMNASGLDSASVYLKAAIVLCMRAFFHWSLPKQ